MRITFMALVLAAVLAPVGASAITLPDVVSLSKAGMPDAVLIALIEREAPSDPIDAQQILALRDQGVSESVLVALLKQPAVPEIIVVGHDPDRPTGSRALAPAPDVPAFFVPYLVAVRAADARAGEQGCLTSAPPALPPPAAPGSASTSGVGHIGVSGVGHIAVSGVGHIWTPPASMPSAAACSPAVVAAAPPPRARPHWRR